MEVWRKIEGFEAYSVSNKGNVRDDNTGLLVKLFGKDYTIVSLYDKMSSKKKALLVHRLVAKAFIPNPDNRPCVNHKDEDKQNNNVSNLEWCTQSYNVNYGGGIDRMIKNNPQSKPVLVDNIKFDSIRLAADYIGISNITLGRKLCNGITEYKGHTISYV